MDNLEFRAVIKHYYLCKKSATEIHQIMKEAHGDNAPSYDMVRYWIAKFRCGHMSTSDDPRSGRPKTATTEDIVDKVHDIILADRRLKLREIAKAAHISYERAHNIVHDYLGLTKLSARWVPRLLTPEQKRRRVVDSEEVLAMIKRDRKDFYRRYVTVDETWVHHYTPETKEQSKQWCFPGERAPKKAKTVSSAGKVMATVFWDSNGVIHTDYLEKGKTITGQYYCDLLDRFDADLRAKRPRLQRKKVLFHHDNAPAHSCHLTAAKLVELGYKIVPHPPYSPDLAPCDFFLFPTLKKELAGKKFSSNDEVITATEAYFADREKSFFSNGLKRLEHRLEKCIELRGDYVEK